MNMEGCYRAGHICYTAIYHIRSAKFDEAFLMVFNKTTKIKLLNFPELKNNIKVYIYRCIAIRHNLPVNYLMIQYLSKFTAVKIICYMVARM